MRRWPLWLMLAGCCVALYLFTLTSVHTYDALSYILDVDRKPWRELFHPHHLAYGPFGALIRAVASALGWAGSAERLLQAVNALAGACGVGLFGLLVARAVSDLSSPQLAAQMRSQKDGGAGATAALLLGASYAYWYYAVEVEVYTIATAFLVVCLGLLMALVRHPSPQGALALGVAQGCAVLFHQTNVLLCLPALVALGLVFARTNVERRWPFVLRLALSYGLPLALIVGGSYLWVGLGVSGFRTWGELSGWLAGYATTGFWGGNIDGAKFQQLGQGLAQSLAQPAGALVGLVLLAVLVVGWPRLRAAAPGPLALCLSWLLVYGAFFLWWEPDNIEFWIASLPPFYLLVVLAAWSDVPEQGGTRSEASGFWPSLAFAVRQRLALIVLACGLVMLVINYAAIARRGDARLDLQRLTARALGERTVAGDLLVLPDGLLELYLPFYEERDHVLSLSQAMLQAHGEWPSACTFLRSQIEGALASGYAVLFAPTALRPEPAPPGEPRLPAERFGLSAATVAACYAPFQAAMELLPLGASLQPYSRLPAAQELADGPGWDFTRSVWGWRIANAELLSDRSAGLVLRPAIDPALTSPPLRIETERYQVLEITLSAATSARDAQLFFVDQSGQIEEARSIRWTLAPGSVLQTYRLDLHAAPGWQGMVTGLRLDPVSVGDGGTVVIASMRLVR